MKYIKLASVGLASFAVFVFVALPASASAQVSTDNNRIDLCRGDDHRGGSLDNDRRCKVVPTAPKFVNPKCDVLGYYVIPSVRGVDYEINGKDVNAGTYNVQDGATIAVTAEADRGHYIPKGTQARWMHTFNKPANCDPVVPAVNNNTNTNTNVNTTNVEHHTVAAAQVSETPSGGVDAGVGGANSGGSLIGLFGTISTVAFGALMRRSLV